MTAIILDTCVLPRRGDLDRNPLISAILRIASLRDYSVLITEMTRTESIAQRERDARSVLSNLEVAISAAAKIFGSAQFDYYLPSADDAVSTWQVEIDRRLELIKLDGDDAIEALSREAYRAAPARATVAGSATGSRDAVIWLTIKRYHLAEPHRQTCFVSSNTDDFAEPSDKRKLRSALAEELGGSVERFNYFPSLDAMVDHIAEKDDVRDLKDDELDRVLSATSLVGLIHSRAREFLPASIDTLDASSYLFTATRIQRARELRAYRVDDTRLSMIEADFDYLVATDDSGDLEAVDTYPGVCRIWIYETPDSHVAEIESGRFDKGSTR